MESTAHSHEAYGASAVLVDPAMVDADGQSLPSYGDRLHLTSHQIRHLAREHGPRGQVVTTYLKQGWAEARLRLRGRGSFRSNQNQKAVQGYAKMKPAEFQVINAVQSWANWRTIPQNLNHRLPDRPVFVLDLCSGAGDSTEVLACYTAAGSRILGLDADERFVAMARQKTYQTCQGQPQSVGFAAQDVLEPFKDEQGRRIAEQSVDLINISGAVAVHFDAQSTARLAGQCKLVIRKGGLALVDAGYQGALPCVVRTCFESRGFKYIHQAKSCLLDLSRQLCFVRV